MSLFFARWSWLAAALLLVLTGSPIQGAPADSGGDAKKSEITPAEKIKKALDQVSDLDISDQPLHLALAQLKEQTKVNFVLDRVTIANMGVDPEQTPVNVKLQNVKLRSALRTMLGQYNLSYAIINDTVVVTSEDMAMHRQLRQRVNVDFDRVQLGAALKQLARETATNMVVDPRTLKESQAPVTLSLEDVPLEMAVRLMAEMAGLRPVRMGNVLFVTSKATAAELRLDPDVNPNMPGVPQEQFLVPGLGRIGIGGIGGVVPGGIPPAPQVVPVPPPPPADSKPNDPAAPAPDRAVPAPKPPQ